MITSSNKWLLYPVQRQIVSINHLRRHRLFKNQFSFSHGSWHMRTKAGPLNLRVPKYLRQLISGQRASKPINKPRCCDGPNSIWATAGVRAARRCTLARAPPHVIISQTDASGRARGGITNLFGVLLVAAKQGGISLTYLCWWFIAALAHRQSVCQSPAEHMGTRDEPSDTPTRTITSVGWRTTDFVHVSDWYYNKKTSIEYRVGVYTVEPYRAWVDWICDSAFGCAPRGSHECVGG